MVGREEVIVNPICGQHLLSTQCRRMAKGDEEEGENPARMDSKGIDEDE